MKIAELAARERFPGGLKYSVFQETGFADSGSLRFRQAILALRERRSTQFALRTENAQKPYTTGTLEFAKRAREYPVIFAQTIQTHTKRLVLTDPIPETSRDHAAGDAAHKSYTKIERSK